MVSTLRLPLRIVPLILLLAAGCGGPEPKAKRPGELETVDVGSGYDADLSTADDPRERQRRSDLGGVLPSDFPTDLPLFSPSSIVDIGRANNASGYVEVDTVVPIAEVRSSLGSRIQRAGWQLESLGEEGNVYTREGRRVRVTLRDLGSGTRIRYDY